MILEPESAQRIRRPREINYGKQLSNMKTRYALMLLCEKEP